MGSRSRRGREILAFAFCLSSSCGLSFRITRTISVEEGGMCVSLLFLSFFFFQGCVIVRRWWWWVYAGSPSLTLIAIAAIAIAVGRDGMAGHNGLGDNRRDVYGRSDRLGNYMNRCNCNRGSVRDDRWGDDRAEAMADGNAGQATGISEGDSQDGSEDSLWRRLSNGFIKVSLSFSVKSLSAIHALSRRIYLHRKLAERLLYREIAIENYFCKNHSECSSGSRGINFIVDRRIISRHARDWTITYISIDR